MFKFFKYDKIEIKINSFDKTIYFIETNYLKNININLTLNNKEITCFEFAGNYEHSLLPREYNFEELTNTEKEEALKIINRRRTKDKLTNITKLEDNYTPTDFKLTQEDIDYLVKLESKNVEDKIFEKAKEIRPTTATRFSSEDMIRIDYSSIALSTDTAFITQAKANAKKLYDYKKSLTDELYKYKDKFIKK